MTPMRFENYPDILIDKKRGGKDKDPSGVGQTEMSLAHGFLKRRGAPCVRQHVICNEIDV